MPGLCQNRRILRLGLILAVLHASIAAAITIGPERAVAPPPVGVASGAQLHVSVATSGEETLVTWIDTTRGREGAYIAALAPDGALLDGSQRWLAPGAFETTISWTGYEYLALWTTPLGIVASTLDRDRVTVVAPRLVLPNATAIGNAAWISNVGMLIYTRGDRVQAATIDREGNVIRPDIPLSSSDFVLDARVFTDGGSFFVFQRRSTVIERQLVDALSVARYDIEGTLLDGPVALWSEGLLPEPWDVAFDGQRFAIVLTQRLSDTSTTLRRILFDVPTMTPTMLEPIALGPAGTVRVEWNGSSQFLAFWMQRMNDRTYELRTHAFAFEAPDGVPVTVLRKLNPSLDADGVWNGRGLVIAWTSRHPVTFEPDILAATYTGALEDPSVFTLSLSHRWQSLAAVGANGNESLVAWIDGSASNGEPRRIVSAHATGGVIDSTPRTHSESVWHEPPVVVFTGTMYLLLFDEIVPGTFTSHIALRRLDTRGTPLDVAPIHVGYGHGFGAAWNGRHLLVAYHSGRDLEAVRIADNGTIVDATPWTLLADRSAYDLSVASNGSDFLLVWSEGVTGINSIDVRALAISANGYALAAPLPVATGPSTQRLSAVASDGRDYAIVYIEDQTLVVKKVFREGTVQATGTVIAQAAFVYSRPAIAATANGYLVAWERDLRDVAGELWLARLDRNLALAEPARVAVRSNLFVMQPTLTRRDDNTVDLAYSRLVDDPMYGATMRLFLRRVEEGPGRSRAVRH